MVAVMKHEGDGRSLQGSDIRSSDEGLLEELRNDDIVIAKKETKDVGRLRLIVMTILLSSSLGVALTAYFFTKKTEATKFDENFKNDAYKVMESIGYSVENTFSSLDMMAIDILAQGRSLNATWPFVVIPYFANRASKFLSLCAGIYLMTNVFVKNEQRSQWEDYSWKNREWVNDTLKIMATDPNYHGRIYEDVPVDSSIQSDYGPVPYNET